MRVASPIDAADGLSGDPPPKWLATAGQVVALIAGAVAVVYLLGGTILALRLAFDHFALDTIVGLIGQLPKETVIAAGFLEGLAPAALVGLVAALIYGARNGPNNAREDTSDSLSSGRLWGLKLCGLLAVSFVLVTPAIAVAIANRGPSLQLGTSLLGIALTWGVVAGGKRGIRGSEARSVPSRGHIRSHQAKPRSVPGRGGGWLSNG